MSRFMQLLLGGCVVLLAVLTIEWFIVKAGSDDLTRSLTPGAGNSALQSQLAEWDKPRINVESYAEMVNRPLFIDGRRPVAEDEAEESKQELGKIEDLELQGIYRVKEQTHTLFRKQGKEQGFEKKAAGDEISGWTLQEIRDDRVIMEQSGEERTLMLRKPKPGTMAQAKTKTSAHTRTRSAPDQQQQSLEQRQKLEQQLKAEHEQQMEERRRQMEERRRQMESVESPNNS